MIQREQEIIELRKKQYKRLFELFSLKEGVKLLEIGACKGGFLKTLKEIYGDSVYELGIENNLEFVSIAREKENVNVVQGLLDDEDIILEGGPFDVFTSFAFPARIDNPNQMLRAVYNNLTEDVVGLIMVTSLEHLLVHGGIYEICNDHIAYYDCNSLRFLVENNGFEVVEQGEEAGIYIYAYVRKKKIKYMQDVVNGIDEFNRGISDYVSKRCRNGKKLAVWCAGHYAFTIICMAGIEGFIECIIDNAKFKQGRYSPASHIRLLVRMC